MNHQIILLLEKRMKQGLYRDTTIIVAAVDERDEIDEAGVHVNLVLRGARRPSGR
jgi:hypothetical protein